MYIDESGDTETFQEQGSNILVLTGFIVEDKQKVIIEERFRGIKQKFYFNPDIEIKSNYLRYANPDIINIDSPIKLKDRAKYDELEKDTTKFLKEIDTTLISVVIDKKAYWGKYPAQNPYEAAYIFLLERFQTFLTFNKSVGICIIDPREGTVTKRFMDKEIDKIHNLVRWREDGFWKKCPNIIERALFSSSDLTVGIQIADLYCYPVFHVFEYNKTKTEYWRFSDITIKKLYYHTTRIDGDKKFAQVGGTGLKFFPNGSKKNFRFFTES